MSASYKLRENAVSGTLAVDPLVFLWEMPPTMTCFNANAPRWLNFASTTVLRTATVLLAIGGSVAGCKNPSGTEQQGATPAASANVAAATAEPSKSLDSAKPVQSAAQQPPTLPAPSDAAKAPADAKKSASGILYKVITPGQGKERATGQDQISFHVSSWTSTGKFLTSSRFRGQPVQMGLEQAPPMWRELLSQMAPGELRRAWVSKQLVGGMAGHGPPEDHVYELELTEIHKASPPPPVPKDVKAAPANAKKTASGLAYTVLKKGTGTKSPTASNSVRVHYTGWMTDGKMFDSSVTRGTAATFPLGSVIKGWTEGVQLMKVGDKFRFWIPPELAYGDKPSRPGAPAGMLVFDVELLEIL